MSDQKIKEIKNEDSTIIKNIRLNKEKHSEKEPNRQTKRH